MDSTESAHPPPSLTRRTHARAAQQGTRHGGEASRGSVYLSGTPHKAHLLARAIPSVDSLGFVEKWGEFFPVRSEGS